MFHILPVVQRTGGRSTCVTEQEESHSVRTLTLEGMTVTLPVKLRVERISYVQISV